MNSRETLGLAVENPPIERLERLRERVDRDPALFRFGRRKPDARDLRRLAARAVFGLARTGSSFSNGSGDFAIAFTTSPEMRTTFGESQPRQRAVLPPDGVSPLFQAALEATEEAVYNSLLRATPVTSGGRTVEAIPIDKVTEILRKYGVTR